MKRTLLLGTLALALAAAPAIAQPLEVGSEAQGVRGAIGLGLIGVELTVTIEAAAGVTNPWLLSLIPLAVGGGAAAGGYFMELESVDAGVATLAIGMTLLVPSILLTLVLMTDEYEPTGESRDAPETLTAARLRATVAAARRWGPPSLVAIGNDGLRLGVPSLSLAEAPAASLYRAGAAGTGFEYRLPLVHWTF
ncbi:MAG: hypothetical protein JXB32_05075 [Deltaproteobacteria bacterium]|nr:hypothetical protein [Deltaproteobacteria bacterium]